MAPNSKRAGFLPPEIWREILSRLPAKSILRCRSVCKSWYSIVSCTDFINYSATNLNKNVSLLLQLYDYGSEICSFNTRDKSLMDSCQHDYVPEPFLGRHAPYMGSCNGLICLSRSDRDDSGNVSAIGFLIWNPSIRKIVELPSRNFCSRTQRLCYLGFGFDSKTYDFKVLCIVGKSAGLGEDNVDFSVANVCEIFDLRKGAWRVISPLVGSSWRVGAPHQDCYLNGAAHWSSDGVILSFDMSDEVFREMKMPNSTEFVDNEDGGDGHVETRAVTFDGLIHLIVWKTRIYDFIDVSRRCSVWAMKEYGVVESWTKMFDIDLRSARVSARNRLWPSHFRLWDNGEVLMVHDLPWDEDGKRRKDLVLYKAWSRKCKHLLSVTKCVSTLCLLEESLVLM